jgi:hypothetical protein
MNGLCDICGAESMNLRTCWLCGARVCPNCFNSHVGLCRKCERGRRMR